MPDQRAAGETRRRVDEIGASMEAYRERLDARYRRVARRLNAAMALLALACVVGFLLLQGERWDATVDGCRRTNQQSESTVGLLRDLNVRESVILIAMARYPHVPPVAHRAGPAVRLGPPPGYRGAMTCEDFASERVNGPRL